jgi:hypothetical protein
MHRWVIAAVICLVLALAAAVFASAWLLLQPPVAR